MLVHCFCCLSASSFVLVWNRKALEVFQDPKQTSPAYPFLFFLAQSATPFPFLPSRPRTQFTAQQTNQSSQHPLPHSHLRGPLLSPSPLPSPRSSPDRTTALGPQHSRGPARALLTPARAHRPNSPLASARAEHSPAPPSSHPLPRRARASDLPSTSRNSRPGPRRDLRAASASRTRTPRPAFPF
jgi:hypothetical protein